MDEERLLERLRKIEALHEGATTPGEERAAAAARERPRARLRDLPETVRAIEHRFSLPQISDALEDLAKETERLAG